MPDNTPTWVQSNVVHAFPKDKVFRPMHGHSSPQVDEKQKNQMQAIVQVLSIYGVLDALAPSEQEGLLRSIADILRAEND